MAHYSVKYTFCLYVLRIREIWEHQCFEQYSEDGPSGRYDPMKRGIEPWLMRMLTVGAFVKEDGHCLLENFNFAFTTRAWGKPTTKTTGNLAQIKVHNTTAFKKKCLSWLINTRINNNDVVYVSVMSVSCQCHVSAAIINMDLSNKIGSG
jgi:hypothetical protein